VEDMDCDATPLNILYYCTSGSSDCDDHPCDDDDNDDVDDDDDDDQDVHDENDVRKDDIYEVEKKTKKRFTNHPVVLPVRRSARLAERQLRLQQMLHDQENKLQDQERDDTPNTNTVLQADVLGSTFVNGRRRSARHLKSTNMACSGL
jgi:hypothetical protein